MLTPTLKQNPEFVEIVETALADYRQWFDDPQSGNQIIKDDIDDALTSGDYWHCEALDDALSEWYANLDELVTSTTNQDTIDEATDKIALIDEYFA